MDDESRTGESGQGDRASPEARDNPYRSPQASSHWDKTPVEPATTPADTASGDAQALRAWRAAVIGLLVCPPLLNLYSAWLLLELAFLDDPLSPAGTRNYYLAWLVDILACLGIGWVIGPGIRLVLG
jgi:hypothetical protein